MPDTPTRPPSDPSLNSPRARHRPMNEVEYWEQEVLRGLDNALEALRKKGTLAPNQMEVPVNFRQLHEQSLRENRPDLYRKLKQSGELQRHLDEVAKSAEEMYQLLVQQVKERNPYKPEEWDGSRGAWEAWAERVALELVLDDRVLVKDRQTERAMRDGYVD